MRTLVYGAGAMGTSFGAELERSGTKCEFVTRNPLQVASLKRAGRLALLPGEMSGTYDLIFLATKQRENRAVAEFLLPFAAENCALVTLQNGLPERGLAEVFGADRVYGCTLGWGAELSRRGDEMVLSVSSRGELRVAVGAYGKGERLGEIVSVLRPAFHVTEGNLTELRYSKLVVNAAFSTLSALSGLTFGEIAGRHKKLALALMRETVAVAEAHGCKSLVQNGHDILKFAKSPFAGLLLPAAMKKHAAIRSGMLRDIEAGKRCDVDFVAGAVVRAGEEKGVDTPLLRRAVALVHDIENGLAELSPETLELVCG